MRVFFVMTGTGFVLYGVWQLLLGVYHIWVLSWYGVDIFSESFFLAESHLDTVIIKLMLAIIGAILSFGLMAILAPPQAPAPAGEGKAAV